MTAHQSHQSLEQLQREVLQVFAEVTRYPSDILDPEAGLEEELGIDSVKLGEIFSVLRERYALPEKLEVEPDQIQNIRGVSRMLHGYLGALPGGSAKGGSVAATAPASGDAGNGNGHFDSQQLLGDVRRVFVEVTRYPEEVLEPTALMEEDLGIDSVKLGEVFSVLRERFRLPEELQIAPGQLRTIQDVSGALEAYLGNGGASAGSNNGAVAAPAASSPPTKPGATPIQPSVNGFLERVTEVFAEVTRYPAEILEPDAALEEDLGIDSVKLGEILSVLRERYDLPEDLQASADQLKTIASISEALSHYVHAAETSAPEAGVPADPMAAGPAEGAGAAGRQSFAALDPQLKPFLGKIALVTGSGRGLGKEIVRYLARLGASVIVNSFHSRELGSQTVEEIRAEGGEATHIWGSVANPRQLYAMFDQIEGEFGGLDFFVSNASNGMLARLTDITVEHWEKAFRTNVVGLHQSALRAISLMKRRGGGKIITLSSPAAHGYVDYFGCMGAVKAAVESLTRSLAIEFADDNIQVNCVSPGPVYGDLLNKWPESERLIAQWETNTAYHRLCQAEDVAHFVAYLLSDPVRLFAGSVLVMDGGISSQGW